MKIKKFVHSALETHKCVKSLASFLDVKQVLKKEIYDKVWNQIQ